MMNLSPMAQDYVKIMWNQAEWSDQPITTSALAQRLDVAPSTVSENVRKLRDLGLVDHARYGDIALTPAGQDAAVRMVRRHRIIETYLVERLGYSWDEVHDEAEVLEHACSDRMIDAMDATLNFPARDPHGDPIPLPDGTVASHPGVLLAVAEPGPHRIVRISDADPALLRFLDDHHIGLDHEVEVGPRESYTGAVAVQSAGRPVLTLADHVASAIWVEPLDAIQPDPAVGR